MIRTLIADDEPIAREILTNFLGKIPDIELIAVCSDGKKALEIIEKEPLDLLLLDIQMPELNGLELVSKITTEPCPVVVYVTAFDHYALQAFDANAIDYLLKPFDFERFERTIQKAIRQVNLNKNENSSIQYLETLKKLLPQEYPNIVTVKDGGRIQLVQVADLTHIEADGNYISLYTDKTRHLLYETLTSFEAKLNPKQFVRIHRSTIVNLNCIKEIQSHFNGDYSVILKNTKVLRMSRNYKDRLI